VRSQKTSSVGLRREALGVERDRIDPLRLDACRLNRAQSELLDVFFAVIGQVAKPKAVASLFSAAPSVAVATLAISVISDGTEKAHDAAIGMVPGAVGLAACCVVAAAAIPRFRALRGSLLAWLTCGVVALGLYWGVFIGDY
jgi:hypothetical protein